MKLVALALLLAGCAATTRTISSGDATLKLWIAGGSAKSDVLVLINGGPGLSHESMTPLQRALASKRLRVVTYDQRGVGQSTAPGTAKLTPGDHLDDLDAIRKALGRDRIHVLGHSFGAMIARSYFDRQPENVASLVLVSPGVSDAAAMQEGGERLGKRVEALQHAGVIPTTIPTDCAQRALAMMPAYFANPRMPIPDALQHRSCDHSGRSSILFDFIAEPYRHHGTLPALVVYGDSEPFGDARAKAAAASLDGPEVVALPHCGHLGWFECRDAFMQTVEPFVRKQTHQP